MRRIAWLTALPMVALAGRAPAAETATPAPAKPTLPYVGIVTADKVYVRSGPGKNHYPTGYVTKDDQVIVEKVSEHGNWLGVRPPKGSFSYIHPDYVKVGENNVGSVTGTRVRVRIGSLVSKNLDAWQLQLSKPATVQVVGAKEFTFGDAKETWLMIEPPAGELRWLSGQFVTFVRPLEGPHDPGTLKPPPPPGPKPDVLAAFKKAEAALEAMTAKPMGQWRFDPIATLYKQVAATAKIGWLRVRARQRLGEIAAKEKTQARLAAFMRIQTETDAKLLELDQQSTAPAKKPTAKPQATKKPPRAKAAATQKLRPGFVRARGVVKRLAIALGDSSEIRFKLISLDGHRTLYFLQSGRVQVTDFDAKRVQLTGRLKKAPGWGADILVVQRVDALKR